MTARELALRVLMGWPLPAVAPALAVHGALAFPDWWRGWLDRPAGRKALQAFDDTRRKGPDHGDDDAIRVLCSVARACYYAATFDRERDPGADYRARLAAARLGLDDLADAAARLQRGFGAGHPGLGWALGKAAARAEVGSWSDQRREIEPQWAQFFGALADALSNPLPELHGGPWFHLYTAGNLHYPTPRSGRPISVDTMLSFELMFHLARWRCGGIGGAWSAGQRLTLDERPAWSLAAALVNATLPVDLAGEQVRDRIRSLPTDVGLMPWPHESQRKRG